MPQDRKLDETDRRIVECLHENARMSMKEIGSRVFLSGQAVRNRIERMEDLGVLQRYTVNVNCPVFGFSVHALLRGRFSRTDITWFLSLCALGKCRIMHCYTLTGEQSTLFDLYIRNVEVMREIMSSLEERHIQVQADMVLDEHLELFVPDVQKG